MRRSDTKRIALSGILAALAAVIMCFGTLMPFATYMCPLICCMTQMVVLKFCGNRFSWIWFATVVILSLLFAPDKEAAMVFLAVGYYPIIKKKIEMYKFTTLLKLLFFNVSILSCYAILVYIMGIQAVLTDSAELGMVGLLITLLMGNATFLLFDRLLTIMDRKLR